MGRPCKGNGPFRQSLALLVACPRGHRAADCLLAATPLRDSWCPVGASPPYGWGVPLADKSFSTNQRTFVGADILSARQRNFTNLLFPSAEREAFSVLLVFACPAGAKTTFSFAGQKKKRFWTPKKKRETSGNLGVVRYNRTQPQPCLVISWVKPFGLSFCFRRPAFERPVVPLAPLPLSGWNTAPCSLVSTPPGGWLLGEGGRRIPAGGRPHPSLSAG